jgi:hypothetical protein
MSRNECMKKFYPIYTCVFHDNEKRGKRQTQWAVGVDAVATNVEGIGLGSSQHRRGLG